ncbi:SDR family oxidoreductase [Streptomyces malaysiensis]
MIVGASRGLGHAMAAEFLDRGWNVIGTVRDASVRTPLHDLADRAEGRVIIEHLDINEPDHLAPLHERLAERRLDLLFVNAGTTNSEQIPIGKVATDDFVEVMITNALSPMRVIEALEDLVSAPDLRVVLGHWGEMLLFWLDRVESLSRIAGLERSVSDYVRSNFHITTSGMLNPALLRHALSVTSVDRLIFSTDYPFQRPTREEIDSFLNHFSTDAEREQFSSANAASLYGIDFSAKP